MLSHSKLFVAVFIILGVVLSVGSVQAADSSRAIIRSGAISYPYLAQPVSSNVNIRSGGGTAYYTCGKLKASENVTVVAEEFGWSKIVPPKGSFSWIAKKYIQEDKANPKVGIVIGDDVRVWVGSPDHDALTSSTTQTKLSKSKFDVVEMLGVEENEYVKIAPPTGAFLYVSANNLKYVGPVGAIDSSSKKKPIATPENKGPEQTSEKAPAKIVDGSVKPVEVKTPSTKPSVLTSPNAKKTIAICREIADKAEAEKEKPYDEQDYTELKKAVAQIANDPKAVHAKAYAEYLTQLIGRYELVSIIDRELKGHAATRLKGKEEIKIKLQEEIGKVVDTGKYVVTGILKPSSIFTGTQKRYIILDKNGRITCYAVPGSYLLKTNLDMFYNKKVALEGTIDKKSYGTVSLVKFTNIVEVISN